jgi:hypothetical protein
MFQTLTEFGNSVPFTKKECCLNIQTRTVKTDDSHFSANQPYMFHLIVVREEQNINVHFFHEPIKIREMCIKYIFIIIIITYHILSFRPVTVTKIKTDPSLRLTFMATSSLRFSLHWYVQFRETVFRHYLHMFRKLIFIVL